MSYFNVMIEIAYGASIETKASYYRSSFANEPQDTRPAAIFGVGGGEGAVIV